MSTNAIPANNGCTSLNQSGDYAVLLPVLATRSPLLNIPQKVLSVFKHFGTDVLIAASFCHLLPTAFGSLLSPCLDQNSTWGKYEAMTGLISMIGLFVVVAVQLLFAEIHGDESFHHHRSEIVDGAVIPPESTAILPAHSGQATFSSQGEKGPKPSAQSSQRMLGIDKASADNNQSSVDLMARRKQDAEEKAALLKVVLLEVGILFHSIFIGMALSVSKGSGLVILFIAIISHQTFEGLPPPAPE